MHPLEPFAGLAEWAAKNTAYNLKFIPEDKLTWKPAPTANSALEIVQHVCGALRSMQGVLDGKEWVLQEALLPTTLVEAQELLTSTAAEYAARLRAVNPAELDRIAKVSRVPIEVPLSRAAIMPVIDLIHHHGQITYLQSLLGDTEFHFADRGT